MRILTAENENVFAYKNEQGEEVVLGYMLCLGKNDNPERYYQIKKIETNENKEEIDNANND